MHDCGFIGYCIYIEMILIYPVAGGGYSAGGGGYSGGAGYSGSGGYSGARGYSGGRAGMSGAPSLLDLEPAMAGGHGKQD